MSLEAAISEALPRPAAYVVGPPDGAYLYKGSARDLKERLRDHQAGRVGRTKNKRPLELFYHEYCDDFTAAGQREGFLKSGQGRVWLRDQLRGRFGPTVPPKADPPRAGNLLA